MSAKRLRRSPASFARFTAEWEKTDENRSGVRVAISESVSDIRASDGENSGMSVGDMPRLSGHALWHASQP